MELRTPTATEETAIRRLVVDAFGDEGPLIADLVSSMLADPHCRVWVANEDGIVGVVGLSRATVEKHAQGDVWVLAPLAVTPNSQGRGIGNSLIRHCLHQIQSEGAAGAFVYGDPDYYGRFGFDRESASQFPAPYALDYPEGWQAMWWKPVGAAGAMALRVEGPLNDPDLW